MNNNYMGVREFRPKCRSFFDEYSNRIPQPNKVTTDQSNYHSLSTNQRQYQEYMKPKRSVPYNSISNTVNRSQRRQSTEPRNEQKRRSRNIQAKVLSQIDLLKSYETECRPDEEIPIGEIEIQFKRQSAQCERIKVNKENQNITRLPTLRRCVLKFEKCDNKNFEETFVTPFFGNKRAIQLDKRPFEFQGLVYKRKK